MVLSAIASRTSQLTLGTNILLVPLYNPVKLAEDIAVLDNISNGRVTVGVAPGYVPEEFAGLMVPYEERAGRFEEGLDILQAAWTQDTFEYSGKYFQIPETFLMPKPVQDPHPQIWYGVSGPRMLERAAERRCPVTGSPRHSVDELVEHFNIYRGRGKEIGYEPDVVPIMRGAFIAATTEEAEEIAGPAVTHLFRETYGKNSAKGARALTDDKGQLIVDEDAVGFVNFKDRYLIGTPDDVIPKVHELRDKLGMTELSCWMQLPGLTDAQVLSSAQLFAREVIPAFAE